MVTFHVPAGPMNLSPLFPSVDFSQVAEYYLEIGGIDGVLATSPVYEQGCCCNEDSVRIFFVNRLGGIDGVTFNLVNRTLEVKSGNSWKKPLKYPLEKWDSGIQRFGVESNEVVVAESTCYYEEDQPWLSELMDSPNAWIQWFGTQGQPNDYLPIVIDDAKHVERKNAERYVYPVEISFRFANENIGVRN